MEFKIGKIYTYETHVRIILEKTKNVILTFEISYGKLFNTKEEILKVFLTIIKTRNDYSNFIKKYTEEQMMDIWDKLMKKFWKKSRGLTYTKR